MTYERPELHEIGMADEVILGPEGAGSDWHELFPPEFTLQDLYE